MSYTAQQILDAALQTSDLNDANLVPPAQVLTFLSIFERKLYIRAARTNPEYFGTDAVSETRSTYTDTWNLGVTPGNIAAVTSLEIETVAGSPTYTSGKVRLVSRRFPELEVAPRATLRGRVVTDYNSELSDSAANYVTVLRIYYSPLPQQLTALTQTVTLPDEWIDLLVLPLAEVFARRDGRLEEAQIYKLEYDEAMAVFEESLQVYDGAVRRPIAAVPPVPLKVNPGQEPLR